MARVSKNLISEEVKKAFVQMGSFKAPGEDGFPSFFYQQNWNVVGSSVINLMNELWEKPERIQEINSTLLVLIPKVDKPEKPLMDKLVSPHQKSFVPKRNIHDNIVIAKEMVHSMNRMNGKKGFMAVKIDLEKAYDRMSWGFIEKVLKEVGLDEHVIKLIMCSFPHSVGVKQKLEKIQRDFIWNNNENKRKLHAVSWDVLCTSKEKGGYRLKDMTVMNDALLGRIRWNLIAKPDNLCLKVLSGKYGRSVNLRRECVVKTTDSEI
ncbi:uncharacterized protein LOC114731914 [Neltuma alba]|uniref:uncharacterized protein LOC114731914 n=1 Tax=Neltuma alba TaxID=207710 RepID=UPI0010A5699B|nr:uncharacterized protein LOC114731914 [Prosopis alba]